jgi:phage-related protein
VNCLSTVAGSVVVAIKAVDEASTVFGKIQASMGILGGTLSQLGGGFQDLGTMISGFAAGGVVGAAAAGVGELVKGLQFSVQQAGEAEAAWTSLQASLKETGPVWDDTRAKVAAFADGLSHVSTVSTTEAVKAIQQFATFGMSAADSMNALKTATDLAAAKHIDLETAVSLVGKAFLGNISTMSRYGIDVDGIKASMGAGATQADLFQAVLAKLNDQFGGAAAAQADTYTGIQERLKNAVGDLGERIGAKLLPALASLTEGMIPVVDAFGKGIDAISSWIDQVGKMPAVKGAMDAASTALSGFQQYLVDTWNSVKDDFGPALQELMNAFKELSDALQPLFEAFGELMGAFGASGDGINLLKILLEGLVLAIKGIADVIKIVVPVVRAFAEGFKEIADIITPPLKIIIDAIGGFIKTLTDAFQGFYDFLVGHSLWQDLWNGVADVARTMGDVLGGIIRGMIDTVTGIFQLGMDAISLLLTTGFTLAFTVVEGIVSGAVDILKGLIQGVQSVIQGTAKDWSDLVNAVGANVNSMKDKISAFWDWAIGFWSDKLTALVDLSTPKLDDIVTKVQQTTDTMKSVWASALDEMVNKTKSSFQQMANDINSQVDAIISRLNSARDEISRHSIWPDMLGEMVSQTQDAMAAIQNEFNQGFASPAGIIPTIQSAAPTIGSATTGSPLAPPEQLQALTVPVNVYLDGQQIQAFVERRLVETISRDAGRSKRA